MQAGCRNVNSDDIRKINPALRFASVMKDRIATGLLTSCRTESHTLSAAEWLMGLQQEDLP